MEQKKINELKKLMGFGHFIRNLIKHDKGAELFIRSEDPSDFVNLMGRCVFEFDDQYTPDNFNEPQTTEFLEAIYSEYMEFKKSEQGETL